MCPRHEAPVPVVRPACPPPWGPGSCGPPGAPSTPRAWYLRSVQAHPLGSISALTLTGWSQDALCDCWSEVGGNRSRLKRREKHGRIVNSITNRPRLSQKSSQDVREHPLISTELIPVKRGSGNHTDEKWMPVRGSGWSGQSIAHPIAQGHRHHIWAIGLECEQANCWPGFANKTTSSILL